MLGNLDLTLFYCSLMVFAIATGVLAADRLQVLDGRQ